MADRAPMQHSTVYIDEAGDEGFGKLAAGPVGGQSRWLVPRSRHREPRKRSQAASMARPRFYRFPIKKTRDCISET